MKKKDKHHMKKGKIQNTDQYHVKKYPGKRPQTVWGSGRMMRCRVMTLRLLRWRMMII